MQSIFNRPSSDVGQAEQNKTMWRHVHEDEGAKAHSLAIVNVSVKLAKQNRSQEINQITVCH